MRFLPVLRRRLGPLGLVSLVFAAAPTTWAAPAPEPAKPKTAAAPANAPAGEATVESSPIFKFERYRLDNGLEVILQEDHRIPMVAVNVRYRVGSKDEVAGRTGFAHLFEHLMFKGSRHVPPGAFDRLLERVGAANNGTTSVDRTTYYETVPSNALELALWLESDRMGFLLDRVDQASFATEREVVKNERRQRYENSPYGLVGETITRALYPTTHPYGHDPIGSMADLDAATVEDVKEFFRTYYVPSDATLALVGDLEPARAKSLVSRYFGTLPKTPAPHTVREPVPAPLEKETRIAMEAGVDLPRLDIVWPGPPETTPDDTYLDIATGLLADGRTSRLELPLVHEMQLAANVDAYTQSGRIAGSFRVVVTLQANKDPAAALARVDQEITRLAQSGPTDEELARAKTRSLTRTWQGAERLLARADLLSYYADLTGDPAGFREDIERVRKATKEDIRAVVQKYLATNKRVVVTVATSPGAPVSGRVVKGASK